MNGQQQAQQFRPGAGGNAAIEYSCADCAASNEIKAREPIRCRSCGCRVMYKKRIKRTDRSRRRLRQYTAASETTRSPGLESAPATSRAYQTSDRMIVAVDVSKEPRTASTRRSSPRILSGDAVRDWLPSPDRDDSEGSDAPYGSPTSSRPVAPPFLPKLVFPSPPSKPRDRDQLQPSGLVTGEPGEIASPLSAATSVSSPASPVPHGRSWVTTRSPVVVDVHSSLSTGTQRPALPAATRSEPTGMVARDPRPSLPRFRSQSAVPTASPTPAGKPKRVSTLFKRSLFGRSKTEQSKGVSSPIEPRSPVTGHPSPANSQTSPSMLPMLSLAIASAGLSGSSPSSPQPLPSHSPSLRSDSPGYQSYFDRQGGGGSARTWKSSLDTDAIVHLTLQHGHDEMHRQEIIFEIIETERAFVDSISAVVQVYGQPIRTGQIEGVPRSVVRLFSRLERILDLHVRLFETLAVAAETQSAGRLVMRFADLFGPYVPELEVYQAYLLRFEAVTAVLDHEAAAGSNPFAAFLHEQARRPEAGGMSLSSFLLKPIQRLMKYPLFFARLLDVTGPSHSDYLATTELSDETDEMIRALQDVKMREEEYEAMKVLESNLVGLPHDFKLAERSRALLFEGTVRQLHVGDRERAALDLLRVSSAPRRPTLRARIPSESMLGSNTLLASPGLGAVPRRTSDRIETPTKERPVSAASDSNASTTASSASCSASTASDSNASTAATSQFTVTPSHSVNASPTASPTSTPSKLKSLRAPPAATPPGSGKRSSLTSPSLTVSTPTPPRPSTSPGTPRIRLRAKESSLHVWVFSDVVLFARRDDTGRVSKSDRGFAAPHRRLLDGLGVARLRRFEDMSRRTDHDHLLEITVDPWLSSGGEPAHSTSLYVVPPLRLRVASGRPSSASSSFSRSSTMTSFSSKISASTSSAATVMPDVDLATFSNLYGALRSAHNGPDSPMESPPPPGTDYWTSRVRQVKADMRARRQAYA
ncbi:hypothetical protein JCM3774_000596 [Rhodotorula dairenensis]